MLEVIGDLATLWRIKGTSSFLLSQAKSIGLSSFYIISNVPPCGNLYLNCLHWKLLAPLHVLVLFLACVCICCASNLLILSNQVCVCWFAHHVRVCHALSLLHLVLFLVGSCERLMEYPLWGSGVLCAPHNPINVCTWVIPSSIDISRLSSRYVVCLLMRNSNSK